MSARVRVAVVDDQRLFREALVTLLSLNAAVQVVGQAENGTQAIELAERMQPDVILMDLRMPEMGGIESTRRIRSAFPQIRMLVLTTFEEDEEIFAAIQAGACGFLLKAAPAEKLIDAILAVARGDSVLQPSVTARLLSEFNRLANKQTERRPAKPLPEALSGRELSVLGALADGLSNKEIAQRLGLAEGTVKNHMTNVLGKLGALDRTQAALRGRELGLI